MCSRQDLTRAQMKFFGCYTLLFKEFPCLDEFHNCFVVIPKRESEFKKAVTAEFLKPNFICLHIKEFSFLNSTSVKISITCE